MIIYKITRSIIFEEKKAKITRFFYKEPIYKEPTCRRPKYLKNLYY